MLVDKAAGWGPAPIYVSGRDTSEATMAVHVCEVKLHLYIKLSG